MRIIFSLAAALTLIFLSVSCKKETTTGQYSYQDIAQTGFSFLKSAQASNEANEQRSATYSAPFEIVKIDRNKEMLNVTVTYPDGCNNSKFTLIWNGMVLESYPEIIFLYFRRTSDCQVAANGSTRILTINLTACLGDAALAQRAKIVLCNSSKKANTENSDILIPGN